MFTLLITFQNVVSCSRLSRSKLIGTNYKYIFIRDYLDKDIFNRESLLSCIEIETKDRLYIDFQL